MDWNVSGDPTLSVSISWSVEDERKEREIILKQFRKPLKTLDTFGNG